MLRTVALATGVTLLAASGVLIAYPALWTHHQAVVGASLAASRAPRQVESRQVERRPGRAPVTVETVRCEPSSATGGVLSGLPGGVSAPVVQGTSSATLAVAVGHDAGTPWPGQAGTSVLLAHDVGYFARNASLRPGQTLSYTAGCERSTFAVVRSLVAKPGQTIPQVGSHELVLDSCWPPNALWFTPDRLLIVARLVDTASVPPSPSRAPAGAAPVPPGAQTILDTWQMGTLTLRGAPPSVAESPEPLALQLDALAWLDAHGPQLAALRLAAAGAPLSVTETFRGEHCVSVELTAGRGAVRVPDGRVSS
jgi:hypothetical protein